MASSRHRRECAGRRLQIASTSASWWAVDRNAASNCDGGSDTPRRRISWKNLANEAVSLVRALAQSVTGRSVKNTVNIDPTRLTWTGTPPPPRPPPALAQPGPGPFERRIRVQVRDRLERGEPGCDWTAGSGQGPGLVDRPERRHARHPRPRDRRTPRPAAPRYLAQARQVRPHVEQLLGPRPRHAEPGISSEALRRPRRTGHCVLRA